MSLPTLDQFAQATVNVVGDTPVREYVPTFARNGEVLVLEGIPEDIDHCEAIQDHAKRNGWNSREFLFGVCSSEEEITVGSYSPSGIEFALLRWVDQTVQLRGLDRPKWWWLEP
jgi:hypothetical protein